MTKVCKFCGKVFEKPQSNSLNYWKTRRFCSKQCGNRNRIGVLHSEEHKRKIRESCKGLKNSGQFRKQMPIGQKCSFCDNIATYMTPNFCCNTHYKRQWQKYRRQRINGKNIMAHRLVMEQFIGRKLSSDEIVHHKDGNQLNNKIENLELMEKIDHLKMHAELRKKTT